MLILFGCTQKNNQSRQFEKLWSIPALSKDGKEIIVKFRNDYQFISEHSKPFDEKGFFIDKKENGDYLIEPVIRSAVRSVIGRYNRTELSAKDKTELKNEIFDSTSSITIEYDKEDKLDVQINEIFLEQIIFSESAKRSISTE